ncbi:unnamed protein product [Cylindrotheca closterium]|uniref:Elongator complex protein 1 n=1 Tax=Cylindrotheca closterium TaxID=2856 RepID=A0AAD2FAX5_9STRA|nr:unnamed protein product [Cylindrotheca closterium]
MENLALLGERLRGVDVTGIGEGDHIADVCYVPSEEHHVEKSETLVLTRNGMLLRTTEEGAVVWTCNLEDLAPGGKWFNVSYNDPEIVCLSKNGAIVSVVPSSGETELVGVFDYGLESAAWSPDGEVLIIVTATDDDEDEAKQNSVLISMNSQFEVLEEVTIPKVVTSQGNDDAQVSVAWRPDGSICAVSSIDEEDNMRKVRMYKRENLVMHAIGRAEDASGSLVRNLQHAGLAWASSGCSQVLAAVQRKGKRTQQIVFFESNGLRHREFALRELPTTSVTSLEWNVDSDLLAVGLREEGGTDKIQLWHRKNYHWYLKREIRYPGQQVVNIKFDAIKPYTFSVRLNSFEWKEYEVQWDPSTTWIKGGQDGQCVAFVTDGCSLNITPLHKALIPPPMFMSQTNLDVPISEPFFCRQSGCMFATMADGSLVKVNQTADEKGRVTYNTTKVQSTSDISQLSLRSHVVIEENSSSVRVAAIACAEKNKTNESLVEILISALDTTEPSMEIGSSIELDGRVLRMVGWADTSNGCLLQMQDGSMVECDVADGIIATTSSVAESLLEPCPWICAIKDVAPYSRGDEHDQLHPRLIFGLSSKSRLYFHDIMLTDSASSLFLSMDHEFLCYATAGSRCQIRFLNLFDINGFDPFMGPDQANLLEGYEPRNVERGAKIVAILPSSPSAVLQMPRGNLEGIFPRALVLRYSMTAIFAGQYGEAFQIMRKHKVDLNLFVDLDPWAFLESGIKEFLLQVVDIDHLNLFIANLRDFDNTQAQARFPVPEWFKRDHKEGKDRSSFDFMTKVSQVCRTGRSVMLKMEENGDKPEGHFLLPVLSTFAKENPPRLDDALDLIKSNALKVETQTKKNPLFTDVAQNSIRYLAFLAEYELLFETALGMYDFEIARAVARNSQMDPKVYLPLLRRLNDLPQYFARFEVDVRLKRYETALRNLFESFSTNEEVPEAENEDKGNSFANCLSLIKGHNLFKLGLELFKNDGKRNEISVALGEHLMKEQQFQTALSVFLSTSPTCVDGAKRAARAAKEWRCYFSLVDTEIEDANPTVDEFRAEQRQQIAHEVATEIIADVESGVSKKRMEVYASAARILLDYGDDIIGGVDMLVKGACWSEAYRVSTLNQRQDLTKKCTDAAIAYAYTAIEDFEDKSNSFAAASEQYATVLNLRKKNIFVAGPDLDDEQDDTGSLFSVASQYSNMSLRSDMSGSSMASNVSSVISVKTATTFTMTGDDGINRHRSKFNKGKKKKQKKKRKPKRKPGSIEELNGLVQTLRLCCPKDEYAFCVAETLQFLIFANQVPVATELFNAYQSTIKAIEESRDKRVEAAAKEKSQAEQVTRVEGEQDDGNFVLIELPIEKEMDEVSCAKLPESLCKVFDYAL